MKQIVWIGIVVMLVACGKTQPQRPSFRGKVSADTTVIRLLTFNQQMANQADVQLAHVVTSDFVMMDENYWVKNLYNQTNNKPCLQDGEYVDIEARFYSLEDSLLLVHQSVVQLGKVDEIPAIVDVLTLMHHDMQISMLVPWYMAFGSAGNGTIPPYENVRVELQVK